MKTTTNDSVTTKINSSLSTLLSYAVLSTDSQCSIFFYEPKRPEGFNDVPLKDLLPKKNIPTNNK